MFIYLTMSILRSIKWQTDFRNEIGKNATE